MTSMRDTLIGMLAEMGAPVSGAIRIDRDFDMHGEPATCVKITLDLTKGGPAPKGSPSRLWFVEGYFTTAQKAAFGGVDFAQQKDIPALMASKVRAVLNGTAEEVQP